MTSPAPPAAVVEDGYLLAPGRLMEAARASGQAYSAAWPFPHTVIDDFLPGAVVERVLAEFPDQDSPYWTTKRAVTSVKQDARGAGKELALPPFIRRVLWELNSAAFLLFLTELTGIEGLIGDPYLEGGGIHQIPPGGFLEVHADFNIHPLTRLDRRLNVLIYLNTDWRPEYGGDLELWSAEPRACAVRLAPIAGRMVAFSTTDTSFHGHPSPLTCPPERTRKSIAVYYYTHGRPAGEAADEHSTLYFDRQGANRPQPKRPMLKRRGLDRLSRI